MNNTASNIHSSSLLCESYYTYAYHSNGKLMQESYFSEGQESWRDIYDENGKALADLLAKAEEEIDMTKPFRFVDQERPWKNQYFTNCTAKSLQVKIFENGKRVYELPSIHEIRAYVEKQLKEEIWQEEQRFHNPHKHFMDMTPDYYEMKMNLLYNLRE